MVQLPPRDSISGSPDELPPQRERPRYRPPVGLPLRKERRIGGFIAAFLLHGLVFLLLIMPFASPELVQQLLGAGGPGPAGGGGGGNRGTGGAKERLEYVQVAPAPKAQTPPPVIRPPEEKPIIPPPPPPPPVEEPKQQVEATKPTTEAAQATAPTVGTGGGTGNDGTAGTGPGTGGGTGSGTGPGTGSSTGPGTGGGTGRVYPPTLVGVFMPPMPIPNRVKGSEVTVVFDIDSTGKVLDFEFSPTRDNGYNRRLREVFADFRFRPAVTSEGVPIRTKYPVTFNM